MLIASIYRAEYDSALNAFYGVDRVFIANADGPFTPSENDKVALLIAGHLKGNVILVPAYFDEALSMWQPRRGGMAGGTFAYTSDSRFTDTLEKITGTRLYGAVSVHDRFENGL